MPNAKSYLIDEVLNLLVSQLLENTTKATPQAIALEADGQELSYAQLRQEAESLAAGLAGLGLRPGDRLALMLPNQAELIVAILAGFRLGLALVPIPLSFARAENGFVLGLTKARALLASPASLQNVPEAALSKLEFLILSEQAGTNQICYRSLLDSRRTVPPFPDGSRTSLVVFTSGSTGAPKGVCHAQSSLAVRAEIFMQTMELGPKDAAFTVFPAARPLGLVTNILAMLGCGGRIVLDERPEPERFWTAYSRSKPTYALLMPAYARKLFAHEMAASLDHGNLKFWLSAGDQPELELFRLAQEKTARPLLNVYGLTETGILALNPLRGPFKPGSMGKPIKGISLRLAGADGNDPGPERTGRLYARGEHMLLGYFENDQATREAFASGWFDTQDLAKRDLDGCYWFMGRESEVIVRSAFNVDNALVVESLLAHPAISQAKVVGIDDPDEGQVPVAFFTLKPGAPLPCLAELSSWMRERVDLTSLPVAYLALEAWPVSPQGKLDRASLIATATALAGAGRKSIAEGPLAQAPADERKAES